MSRLIREVLARASVVARGAALAGLCVVGAAIAIATGSAAGTPTAGYSPQTLQRAYGVSPLLRQGVDGRGETVVLPETLPEPEGNTNIRQDLAAFDKRYHLPAVDLTLAGALGFTGNTSLADSEEVQDAEAVHTIAPAATISIMLIPLRTYDTPSRLASVMRSATDRGNIVSFSQSECEARRCLSAKQLNSLNRALRYAVDRHVSIFSSAGDSGADVGSVVNRGTRGVRVPASSPLVTGVGGTTLTVRSDGAYGSESVWDDDVPGATSSGARLSGTGGGLSARYTRPSYQDGLPGLGDHRGVPDVSAIAEPGMATVIDRNGHVGAYAAGGTSESAPLWAGIAALADQHAHRQLGFLNPALYRIGHSDLYHRAFHDITRGNNSVTLLSGTRMNGYRARPGWDPVTGWGSPNAQVLVPLLGKQVRPSDGPLGGAVR